MFVVSSVIFTYLTLHCIYLVKICFVLYCIHTYHKSELDAELPFLLLTFNTFKTNVSFKM